MRLIIVSNRLPISVSEKNGKLKVTPSIGGVSGGLETYLQSLKKSSPKMEFIWLGWPGSPIPESSQGELESKLARQNLKPVFLSAEQIENFYNGFSNDTIWPLFHYFPSYAFYKQEQWAAYKEVNEKFAQVILEVAKPGDVIWIHDYHFMLLPRILREKLHSEVSIGFFLHIPFPVFEMYRLLPDKWRRNLLNGMLGADLIGFHTYDYMQYFMSCVQRVLGYETSMQQVTMSNRSVRVDTFPMGIDYEKYSSAAVHPQVQHEQLELKKITKKLKVIISVDRLDYTKGILKRLEAYDLFLRDNPQYKGKVLLWLIVVPSRVQMDRYQEMKRQVDELVGKINGEFGSLKWTPIIYQYKPLDFYQLVALYFLSDVALVTPLRDGMNLVAKEYLATRGDRGGVLILSEMAGSSYELGEAVVINPNHTDDIAWSLTEALRMPLEEQQTRNALMQDRLKRYNVVRWAEDYLQELRKFKQRQEEERESKQFSALTKSQVIKSFKSGKQKLLLLDYDGTLAPFTKYPHLAIPTPELLKLLTELANQPNTKVVIISGRDKQTLDKWFKKVKVQLVAEHGVWVKQNNAWELIKPLQNSWKKSVIPIMKTYVDRVPGSFIEEKDFSLVWHYRIANPELASLRAKELTNNLLNLTANMDVQVVPGNKIIEIKTAGADKGSIALKLIEQNNYDFILAAGDDTTDEDLFKVLPKEAFSVKVGSAQSAARFCLSSHTELIALLEQLVRQLQPRKKVSN